MALVLTSTAWPVELERRVFEVFCRVFPSACSWSEWQQTDTLRSLASIDSMSVLEFLAALEEELQFRFPAEDLDLELFVHRTRLLSYLSRSGISGV